MNDLSDLQRRVARVERALGEPSHPIVPDGVFKLIAVGVQIARRDILAPTNSVRRDLGLPAVQKLERPRVRVPAIMTRL
jgi:hypothetical protein